jgi:superfamily II helicase
MDLLGLVKIRRSMQTMRKMLKMEKVSIGSRNQEQIFFLQHTNHLKINLLDIINQCKCGKKIAGTLQEKGAKGVTARMCQKCQPEEEVQNMGEASEEEEEGLGQAIGGEEEAGIENIVEQNEEGGEFKLK